MVENRTEDRPAFERQVRGFFAGLIYGEEHKNIMEAKEWKEKVLTQKKNGYDRMPASEREAMNAYCEGYKAYLDAGAWP